MKTTTRPNWRFTFTISDLGRLLGKSPVTLRGWETKGFLTIPRDPAGDRKVNSDGVRTIGRTAHDGGRITGRRLDMINAAMTLVEWIESENNKKVKR